MATKNEYAGLKVGSVVAKGNYGREKRLAYMCFCVPLVTFNGSRPFVRPNHFFARTSTEDTDISRRKVAEKMIRNKGFNAEYRVVDKMNF